jgi:D-3-phosphoglycerate dehydrogenase
MNKPRVLVIDFFDTTLLKDYRKKFDFDYKPQITLEELIKFIKFYDALIISTRIPIRKPVIDNADRLKLIIRMGAGVDHIDLKLCSKNKIIVCNTPNSNVSPVVEYLFGQLIRIYRDFDCMHNNIINGCFRDGLAVGEELSSKTIGIIGAGRIGGRVAKVAKCFGMKVYANDPYLDDRAKNLLPVDKWLSKKELIRKSDIVTLHVPLTKKTEYLITRDYLSLMKKDSVLVNVARGKVVKMDDVINYARKGIIKKFILDVFENEPYKSSVPDDVKKYFYFSPHAGAFTRESFYARSREALEELDEFYKNKLPHGYIDPVKGY